MSTEDTNKHRGILILLHTHTHTHTHTHSSTVEYILTFCCTYYSQTNVPFRPAFVLLNSWDVNGTQHYSQMFYVGNGGKRLRETSLSSALANERTVCDCDSGITGQRSDWIRASRIWSSSVWL